MPNMRKLLFLLEFKVSGRPGGGEGVLKMSGYVKTCMRVYENVRPCTMMYEDVSGLFCYSISNCNSKKGQLPKSKSE
jgi:hypothetical protein